MLTRRSALVGLGALAPGLARAEEDRRPFTYAMLNHRAPSFALPRFGGGVDALSDYRGKALMLTFGGLWCPACIVDNANLARLAALAGEDAHLAFLYVHNRPSLGRWSSVRRSQVTPADADAAYRAYFAEAGFSFPVAFDLARDTPTADAYAIEAYPSSLIIDSRGRIAAWQTDFGSVEAVEAFYEEARRAV